MAHLNEHPELIVSIEEEFAQFFQSYNSKNIASPNREGAINLEDEDELLFNQYWLDPFKPIDQSLHTSNILS